MSSPGEYYGITSRRDDKVTVTSGAFLQNVSPKSDLQAPVQNVTKTHTKNTTKKEEKQYPKLVKSKKKKDDIRKYLGQIIHQQHDIITTLSKLTEKVSKIERYILLHPLMNQISNNIAFEKVKEEYEGVLSSISRIVKV